jgi:hypothetical protein
MTLPNKSQQVLVKNKLSHQWRVRSHLILSILVAVVVAILLPHWFSLSTRILCIWNAGMISFLLATLNDRKKIFLEPAKSSQYSRNSLFTRSYKLQPMPSDKFNQRILQEKRL